MKGLLSKVEYIVIGVLALIFLMWTASKCNAHKAEAQDQATVEAQEDSLAQADKKTLPPPIAQQPAAQQQPASSPDTYQPIDGSAPATTTTTTATQPATGTATTGTTAKPAAQTQAAQTTTNPDANRSKLYVTIDKLKVRKTPGLKGDLLGELKLFDEVYYMDEVTDSSFTVNLGTEKATEPYVKIKTKRGTVGWVFGAGVHYAKKKRSGVLQ
ncbi:MAG: SH3 domain-containing protein [Saprospiraceae bacterium]|nr:SH3 domain-containing protein [Saprospiraceae bacterium]